MVSSELHCEGGEDIGMDRHCQGQLLPGSQQAAKGMAHAGTEPLKGRKQDVPRK